MILSGRLSSVFHAFAANWHFPRKSWKTAAPRWNGASGPMQSIGKTPDEIMLGKLSGFLTFAWLPWVFSGYGFPCAWVPSEWALPRSFGKAGARLRDDVPGGLRRAVGGKRRKLWAGWPLSKEAVGLCPGEVLGIGALGQAVNVPFDVGQEDAIIKAMQGFHLAAGGRQVARAFVLSINKATAVGDGIADLNYVGHFRLGLRVRPYDESLLKASRVRSRLFVRIGRDGNDDVSVLGKRDGADEVADPANPQVHRLRARIAGSLYTTPKFTIS